jgi:hypothetical protein
MFENEEENNINCSNKGDDYFYDFINGMKGYLPESIIPDIDDYNRFINKCSNKKIFEDLDDENNSVIRDASPNNYSIDSQCIFWVGNDDFKRMKYDSIVDNTETTTTTTISVVNNNKLNIPIQLLEMNMICDEKTNGTLIGNNDYTENRVNTIPISSFFMYDNEEYYNNDKGNDCKSDNKDEFRSNEYLTDRGLLVPPSKDMECNKSNRHLGSSGEDEASKRQYTSISIPINQGSEEYVISKSEQKRKRLISAGRFYMRSKEYSVKRICYMWYSRISIDKNYAISNKCSNRKCINPRHMLIGIRNGTSYKKGEEITELSQLEIGSRKGEKTFDTSDSVDIVQQKRKFIENQSEDIPSISKNKRRRKFIKEKTDILIGMIERSNLSQEAKKELDDFCKLNSIHRSIVCKLRRKNQKLSPAVTT